MEAYKIGGTGRGKVLFTYRYRYRYGEDRHVCWGVEAKGRGVGEMSLSVRKLVDFPYS